MKTIAVISIKQLRNIRLWTPLTSWSDKNFQLQFNPISLTCSHRSLKNLKIPFLSILNDLRNEN